MESEAILQSVQKILAVGDTSHLKFYQGTSAKKLCALGGHEIMSATGSINVGYYCTVSQTIRRLNFTVTEENDLVQNIIL